MTEQKWRVFNVLNDFIAVELFDKSIQLLVNIKGIDEIIPIKINNNFKLL